MHVPAETFHIAAVNTFLAGWVSSGTTLRTPVKLRNVRGCLTKSDGTTRIAEPPRDSPWVEFCITENDLGQMEFGSATTNQASVAGLLGVEIYVPVGTGEATAKGYASTVKSILQKKTIANVKTRTCVGQHDVGQVDAWHRYDVFIPYFRLEQV